jgi:uncharacterized protein (DUF1778 family)
MDNTTTQLSAHVSVETKRLLDAYVDAHGVKKAFLLENALLHHLRALREIPEDVIIPPRLVVTAASGERILERLSEPVAPTPAMVALMAREGDDGD